MVVTQRSKLMMIAVAVFLAAMVTFLAGLASAGPNPPGNNGTIKIDDTPFDDPPTTSPMSAVCSRSTSTATTKATWTPP